MNFTLTSHQKQNYEYWFNDAPYRWDAMHSLEVMRTWQPILTRNDQILVMHQEGAIAKLERFGPNITGCSLIEGVDAEKLARQYAFRVSDELARESRTELSRGVQVDAALDAVFGMGHRGITEIVTTPLLRMLRPSRGPVLEVQVKDGIVQGYTWHQGGDAIDVLESMKRPGSQKH